MLFVYLNLTDAVSLEKSFKICNFAALKKHNLGVVSPEVLQRLKSLVSICAPEVPEMSPQTLDL